MARRTKSAAAVAMVAVLLVVLGGPWCHCVQAQGTPKCVPDIVIKRYEEKFITAEKRSSPYLDAYLDEYVVPLPGFDGVLAKIITNKGTFQAWFPILDHCSLDNAQFWKLRVYVKKITTTLTIGLWVHNCDLLCEQNTDTKHTSWSDLEIQNMELYGRGHSKWKQQRPDRSCGMQSLTNYNTKTLPSSCTEPPPISTTSPPHPSTEQQTTQQHEQGTSSSTPPLISTNPPASDSQSSTLTLALLGAAGAVVVLIAVVVVVFIRRNSRQQQNQKKATHQRNSLDESVDHHNQQQQIQQQMQQSSLPAELTHDRNSLYESVCQYHHQQQEQQIQQSSFPAEVTHHRNSLYESLDQYRHHSSGSGQGDTQG